ncbi:MAG: universal stress protein [Terriglobia bacterium]
MKILLAIDESAASEAAVSLVVDQAKPKGTDVRLLHVVDSYPERLAKRLGGHDSPDFCAARLNQRRLAQELLERASGKLRAAGFSVSSSIEEGDVRAIIIQEANVWRADLIVLGSSERKGIRYFWSTSIAEDVARAASCSVEIARARPWAADCALETCGASSAV